jgi:hypothetical protein
MAGKKQTGRPDDRWGIGRRRAEEKKAARRRMTQALMKDQVSEQGGYDFANRQKRRKSHRHKGHEHTGNKIRYFFHSNIPPYEIFVI